MNSPAHQRAIIIIPTVNEASNIANTIGDIEKAARTITDFTVEVLVYDSASQDKTPDVVRNLTKTSSLTIHLLEEGKKSGLGSAYAKAMQHAIDHLHADIIFEFDADGSHNPKYIKPMLDRLNKGADVVVGSRYVNGGSIPKDWGWHRKLLSGMGNWVARLLLFRKHRDYTSGFRCSKVRFLKEIGLNKLLSKNYAYKLHIFCAQHQLGARIEEHPIQFTDRTLGESKLPRNSIMDSLRVLIILRARMLKLYGKTCLIGLGGSLTQFLVFNLLRFILLPVTANLIAIESAIVVNFLNHNRFTFRQTKITTKKRKLLFQKFIEFNFLSIGSIIIQSICLSGYHHFLTPSRINENLAILAGIFIASITNYWGYTRRIWRKDNEPEKKLDY